MSRRKLMLAVLAAVLMLPGCRKRVAQAPPPPPPQPDLPSSAVSPLPPPPPVLPPQIESPKSPPADPTGTLPQFPPAPPKPEPRKPVRVARTPPAPKPEPAEEVKPDVQTPAPPPLLGEALTPERRSELERGIDASLAEVDAVIEQLKKKRLGGQQREALDRIRSLAANARSMRTTEPTTSAELATRAAVLARELLESLRK